MPVLILSQIPWSAFDTRALEAPLAAARSDALRTRLDPAPVLVLLPQAVREIGAQATTEAMLLDLIGALARQAGLFIAGSATVTRAGSSGPTTVAFLVSDAGEALLAVPRVSPEVLDGFGDTSCVLGAEAPFPVVGTPFGQVGLLPGEDVLYAPYARALAFHGAELILNPAAERADDRFEIRQCARLGRAGENTCYVACATPSRAGPAADAAALPSGTALHSFMGSSVAAHGSADFVFPDYDLDLLRRARVNPHRSFPALVRANLYGRGYARAAAARAPGEPPAAAAPATADAWRTEARRRLEAAARRHPPRHERYEEQYEALLVQHCARLIPLDRSVDAPSLIERNLDEALALAGSRANLPSVRLVVFPEFWLTGPGGIGGVQRGVEDMERLAISYPGPVFDRVATFAQAHKVYVAFQNFELHPKFPHRVFNSAFLLDDAGNLVHTYRKNQCADVWGLLPDTTPGSILSRYLDTFGPDALFPVADTPLGRLANMICFDNMVPEVAQGLRRAGAEIILHSSSEPHGGAGREVWDTVRRLRAFDNTCYVLSAIDGGEHVSHDSDTLSFFRRGHSRIVRFDGRVEGTVDGPGPVAFRVGIDLAALRRARGNPLVNLSLWDDPVVYARHYGGDVGLPNDIWDGDPLVNPYAGARQLRERIASYVARGVYVPPGRPASRASLPDSV
jgi:predicted amidohydrolase